MAPATDRSIGVAIMEVKSSGVPENGPIVHRISLAANTSVAWGVLAAATDALHLLWRDDQGRLFYASEKTPPVTLISAFRSEPPPALLIGDGAIFAAGVRDNGAFGIDRLSPTNVLPASAR